MPKPAERYEKEAPTPTEPTLKETIRYIFDENLRRSYQSTKNLTQDEINSDPGHGAWSIGNILKHQLDLIGLMLENLQPGSTQDLSKPDLGSKEARNLDALLEHREVLADAFRRAWHSIDTDSLMERRHGVRPEQWADWPVLMRLLRPLTDLSTHTGQINYRRRQLGKPVEKY